MISAAFVSAGPLSTFTTASTKLCTRPVMSPRRKAPVMNMRNHAAKLAAIPATLATAAAPVLATEGTGEGLGIDTPLLLIPFVLIPLVFFVLFIQFSRSQDNEDFTGTYDERRN